MISLNKRQWEGRGGRGKEAGGRGRERRGWLSGSVLCALYLANLPANGGGNSCPHPNSSSALKTTWGNQNFTGVSKRHLSTCPEKLPQSDPPLWEGGPRPGPEGGSCGRGRPVTWVWRSPPECSTRLWVSCRVSPPCGRGPTFFGSVPTFDLTGSQALLRGVWHFKTECFSTRSPANTSSSSTINSSPKHLPSEPCLLSRLRPNLLFTLFVRLLQNPPQSPRSSSFLCLSTHRDHFLWHLKNKNKKDR